MRAKKNVISVQPMWIMIITDLMITMKIIKYKLNSSRVMIKICHDAVWVTLCFVCGISCLILNLTFPKVFNIYLASICLKSHRFATILRSLQVDLYTTQYCRPYCMYSKICCYRTLGICVWMNRNFSQISETGPLVGNERYG